MRRENYPRNPRSLAIRKTSLKPTLQNWLASDEPEWPRPHNHFYELAGAYTRHYTILVTDNL